jgi:hypothetical protein
MILTYDFRYVSLLSMTHDRTIRVRQKLLSHLPVTGEILRGSLLERTVRSHASGCAKCASGEGHPLWVLTVSYPGRRTRQFSLRRERVAEVRRWLSNYHKLKNAIEAICELNHDLLRPEATAAKSRGKSRD